MCGVTECSTLVYIRNYPKERSDPLGRSRILRLDKLFPHLEEHFNDAPALKAMGLAPPQVFVEEYRGSAGRDEIFRMDAEDFEEERKHMYPVSVAYPVLQKGLGYPAAYEVGRYDATLVYCASEFIARIYRDDAGRQCYVQSLAGTECVPGYDAQGKKKNSSIFVRSVVDRYIRESLLGETPGLLIPR